MLATTEFERPLTSASDAEQQTAPRSGADVWDRVWRSRPSAERDDALLEREAGHARWGWVRRKVADDCGSLAGVSTIELGSGRGDWSALFAREGATVTLFDSSERGLSQANWRFERLGLGAELLCGDLFALPQNLEGKFDVAMSSGVIEHFRGEQRTRALEAHRHAVRPGGTVVISVPHACCPSYRLWKAYLELRGWWPYGHERPFTAAEMRRRAAKAGLVAIETRCFGFLQSVGDHVVRALLGRAVDWAHVASPLDRIMGSMLVLAARRPGRPR